MAIEFTIKELIGAMNPRLTQEEFISLTEIKVHKVTFQNHSEGREWVKKAPQHMEMVICGISSKYLLSD